MKNKQAGRDLALLIVSVLLILFILIWVGEKYITKIKTDNKEETIKEIAIQQTLTGNILLANETSISLISINRLCQEVIGV